MIQKTIDRIEEHIEENPSHAQLSERIGYSRVFYYPTFDFLKGNDRVVGSVEQMAWNYNINNYRGVK